MVLSDLFNLHQVANFVNHTQDLGSSFHFFRSIQFFQTQCNQSLLLALRPVDTAFNLCYFYLFHDVFIYAATGSNLRSGSIRFGLQKLSVEYFAQFHATCFRNLNGFS